MVLSVKLGLNSNPDFCKIEQIAYKRITEVNGGGGGECNHPIWNQLNCRSLEFSPSWPILTNLC